MARSRMRLFTIPAACLVLLLLADDVRGERRYAMGVQLDAVAGWSDRGATDDARDRRSMFYAGYPSLNFRSTGQRSEMDASYSSGPYGATEFDGAGRSHAIQTRWRLRLGPRWKVAIADSFSVSPDLTTFHVLTGSAFDLDATAFRLEPVVSRRSTSLHAGAASFDWEAGPESSLSFVISHSARRHATPASLAGRLSDQWGLAGDVLYTRRIGKRRSWSVRYGVERHSFRELDGALTHSAAIGYSYQLSSSLSLRVDGGPAYTEALGSTMHYVGCNASLSLVKSIRSNSFSLSYSRESGDTTGFGSVSDVQGAGISFVRVVGRKTTVHVLASTLDARHRLDNPLDVRGFLGSVSVGFLLGEHWSLNAGGSYQRYGRTVLVDAEQRHVFVSLRLHVPEVVRLAR